MNKRSFKIPFLDGVFLLLFKARIPAVGEHLEELGEHTWSQHLCGLGHSSAPSVQRGVHGVVRARGSAADPKKHGTFFSSRHHFSSLPASWVMFQSPSQGLPGSRTVFPGRRV